MNDDNRTPVITPIIALLKSRKVVVALTTLIVNGVVVLVPQLEPVQPELMVVLSAIGGILIGAIAYEDAAQKR